MKHLVKFRCPFCKEGNVTNLASIDLIHPICRCGAVLRTLEREAKTLFLVKYDDRRVLKQKAAKYMYVDAESEIPIARNIYRKAFNEDQDFRYGYVANIAMCMWDGIEKVSGYKKVSAVDCNKVAEMILELLFESD